MKKFISIALCILFLGTINSLHAQDLDKILEKHFKATGLEELSKINTMKTIGKTNAMGMNVPYTTIYKRSNKYYVEMEIQGAKMIQAYDGNIAWMTMPWTGSLEPKVLSGPQLKSIASMADFDGPLHNYKEKGYTAELIGKEDMEGTGVYKIKVVMDDDLSQFLYMDAEKYLILKQVSKINYQGTDIESEVYLGDYKTVEGMTLPHSTEVRSGGQQSMKIIIERYVFNEKIDDSLFAMPVDENQEEMPEDMKEE